MASPETPSQNQAPALTTAACAPWAQPLIRRVRARVVESGTVGQSSEYIESVVIGILRERGVDPTRQESNTGFNVIDLAEDVKERIEKALTEQPTQNHESPPIQPPTPPATLVRKKAEREILRPATIAEETKEQILASFGPRTVTAKEITAKLLKTPTGIDAEELAKELGMPEKNIEANLTLINKKRLAAFGLRAIRRDGKYIIVSLPSTQTAAPEQPAPLPPTKKPENTTPPAAPAPTLPESPAPPPPATATPESPEQSPESIAATIRADALVLISKAREMLGAAANMTPGTLNMRAGLFREGSELNKDQEEAQIPHYQQITLNILENKELSTEEKTITIFSLSMNLDRSGLLILAITVLETMRDHLQKEYARDPKDSTKTILNKTMGKITRIKSQTNQSTEIEEDYFLEILNDKSSSADTRERAFQSLAHISSHRSGEVAKALGHTEEKLKLEQERAKQNPKDAVNVTFATISLILKLRRTVGGDKGPEGKIPEIRFFQEALEHPELDIKHRIKALQKLSMLCLQINHRKAREYAIEALRLRLQYADAEAAPASSARTLRILIESMTNGTNETADISVRPQPEVTTRQRVEPPPAAPAPAPAPEKPPAMPRPPASVQNSIAAQRSGDLASAIEIMERVLSNQERIGVDKESILKSDQRLENLKLALRVVNEGQPAISRLDPNQRRYVARTLKEAKYTELADQCIGFTASSRPVVTTVSHNNIPPTGQQPLPAPQPQPAHDKTPEEVSDLRSNFLEWIQRVESISGKWAKKDGYLLVPDKHQGEIQGTLEKMLREGDTEKLYIDYLSATSNDALQNMVERKLAPDLRVGKIKTALLQQLENALEAI